MVTEFIILAGSGTYLVGMGLAIVFSNGLAPGSYLAGLGGLCLASAVVTLRLARGKNND